MLAALALGAWLLGKLVVPEPLPVSSHSILDNRLKTLGKVLGPGVFGLLFTSGLHRLWPNVQLFSGRSAWRLTGGGDTVDADALLREGKGTDTPHPSPVLEGPSVAPAVPFRQGVLWGYEESGEVREGGGHPGPCGVSPDSWVSSFLLYKRLTRLWLLSTHFKHGDLE